jgi:hypothetical protein
MVVPITKVYYPLMFVIKIPKLEMAKKKLI